MLYADQYYSMTLGRPLGITTTDIHCISSSCLFPDASDRQIAERFQLYFVKYILLSQRILSSKISATKRITEFVKELLQLEETLVLDLNQSWLTQGCENIPAHPWEFYAAVLYCNIHSHLILLHRRWQFCSEHHALWEAENPPIASSCHRILRAFCYCCYRIPTNLVHWSICQQAFNAAMTLGLDMLGSGNMTECDIKAVESTRSIFLTMQQTHVSPLAEQAALRLSQLLDKINKPTIEPKDVPIRHCGMMLLEDSDTISDSTKAVRSDVRF